MSKLEEFANYAKDAKSPEDLYEAMKKLGPLLLYHEREGFVGEYYATPEGIIQETEPAKQEARAVCDHARRIAIRLRELDRSLDRLPKNEADPFADFQIIQEWCLDADQGREQTGNGKDLASEPAPKSQAKKLRITDCHKKAYRSCQWVCDKKPDLIPLLPTRYTRAMYVYMKENCPEYDEESVPQYTNWKRYLRHYERVLHGLKNTPRAGRAQPKSAIDPNDIQSVGEITNRFKKD